MKLDWRSTLGIALSVLLLVWTLRDVSLNEVYTHLMASNLPLFILSAVTATLIYPLRARRWRIILSPVAPELPFGMLWRATAVGMMVNNVVPARAGGAPAPAALAELFDLLDLALIDEPAA